MGSHLERYGAILNAVEINSSFYRPHRTATYERWAEFSQGGAVKGREVVSIVAKPDIGKIAESSLPAAGKSKVELLKGGDFLRVWINKGDANYLIHLQVQGAAGSN